MEYGRAIGRASDVLIADRLKSRASGQPEEEVRQAFARLPYQDSDQIQISAPTISQVNQFAEGLFSAVQWFVLRISFYLTDCKTPT